MEQSVSIINIENNKEILDNIKEKEPEKEEIPVINLMKYNQEYAITYKNEYMRGFYITGAELSCNNDSINPGYKLELTFRKPR